MSMAFGTFGLFYYLVFIVVASFILLNMFVSILNGVMAQLKAEGRAKSQEDDQYNLLSFVWKLFQDTLGIDIDRHFRSSRNEQKLIEMEKEAEEHRKQLQGTVPCIYWPTVLVSMQFYNDIF